ncbi:MAG TPA: MBG domain-containing protein [Thermoanaerobaculia bacterium]|nr:MBG domain-containing protein [Thermoanaerobaculia bacterium]
MKRFVFSLAILCSLFLAGSLRAQQQFPTLERGLQPEKLYHFAGIDNVNVFNGNLTIVLPIGQSYPVNGGLSYQLTLSYNSNLWDWETFATISGSGEQKAATPARHSNAGVGWILGYGSFLPKSDPDNNSFADVFVAPDGGDHRFDKSTGSEPNVKYTTDGSNLRLRTLLLAPTLAWIDFPDGTVQHWEQNADKHWDLLDIDAPHGNAKVTFTKPTSRPSQCGVDTTSWLSVTDGTRTHYICFKDQNVDFVNKPMVDAVVLDGPQNQATVYRFTYDTFDVLLPRGEPYPQPGGVGRTSHRVTVLKSIILPDQSSYRFEHDPDRFTPVVGLYSDPNLLSVALPTGGRIEYTYWEQYNVPPIAFCVNGIPTTVSGETDFGTPPSVVTSRTVRPAPVAGAVSEGPATWSYVWGTNSGQAGARCLGVAGPNPLPNPIADELIAVVTDPDGGHVDAHFSVWPGDMIDDSVNGFKALYYGFPYGKYDPAQDRYLSTEQFTCVQCTPLRSTYVRHDVELRDNPFPAFPDVAMPIHRLASQRVFYRDDPATCVTTATTNQCRSITAEFTDWDGFAHYRTGTSSHDFDSGGTRTETTDWNEVGGIPRVITSSDPWTLDEFENRTTVENGVTIREQACFAPVPGTTSQRFLRATRALKTALSPGPADLITLLSLNSDGNPNSEGYFGGESTPLPGGAATASSLCAAISSLGSPSYEITHSWQNGVLASSQYTGASFLSTDLTIDRSGLVTESRDSARVLTTYSYDASGRILRIVPTGVSAIAYSYSPAQIGGNGSLIRPAEATQKRESSSDPTESDFFFDSLGRVWREATAMPNGKSRLRESLFDTLARRKSVSEWADLPAGADPLTQALPGYATTFAGYDPFGRVGSVTSADGSLMSFEYTGDRVKKKTSSIATSLTGPSSVSTTEHYDGFGRLTSVTEPSGSTSPSNAVGADITTAYTYDPTGHLATVKMTDETGAHQDRSFQYDGRGFLAKETHPESGDTTYDQYDARGHVVTRLNAGTTLTFAYDAAERLHTVTDQAGKTIKQFEYGTDNSGSDLRNGKVVSAVRRNDLTSAGRIDVTESYQYGEIAGQMSIRTTSVEHVSPDGATRAPIQQFAYGLSSYDDLLLPQTITMPTCSLFGCTAQTTQQGLGSVTNTRNAGFLSSVNGFASLTYQPSGMVENVVHATPQLATDKYAARFGQARPSKITFASCGNTAPVFLPGTTVVKPITTGSTCGIQVTWPPAVLCGGSNDIRYRVLRDGVDITGQNCLTDPKFVDQNVSPSTTYAYTVVAEGPAVAGLPNPGRCEGGQTTQLPAVSGEINTCNATTILTVSPVIASVGLPATFRANLSSANGPAVGEELIFSLNNEEIGRPHTGADGTAILSHVVDLDPNTYPDAIAVTYAGGILPATTTPITATLTAFCDVPSYTIKPLALNVLAAGGPLFDVFVNTSSHCQWNPIANAASGDNPFLEVNPTSTRTGKGTFNISIPANAQPDARSSHVSVAQQLVSVDQGGTASGCTYRFVPEIAFVQTDIAFVDTIMPVTATAGCQWTASADPSTPWIHFNPQDPTAWSGTGNGQIHFSVDPNPGTQKREATVLLSDGTTTVAKGFVNQLAPLPAVCPITFVEDLSGGTVEKSQNIPLRVHTTGTQLQYQWFINDRPISGDTNSPSLTLGFWDPNYPAPGQSISVQVRVYNSCGEAFSNRVTWQNNATPGQCQAPFIQDSIFTPNRAPYDGLSPFPGALVSLFVVGLHSNPNDTSPITYTWYRGLPGDRSSRIATNPDDGTQDNITVSPFQTSFYWVELTDSCGTQQSRSAAIFTTIPPSKRRAVSHDFTGDGRSDLAWHNTATGQNEIWQMNGTIHASTIALPANQDSNAQLQSTGDFAADGNTDIVWRDPQTGNNEVWLMNRTQVSQVQPLQSRTDPNWTIGAVADYDNDNNDDIVWHNSSTGENEIWFMSGTDHGGTWALPSNPDGQWGLYGTGDFNNDEKPDLFFHNRSTGENQVWMMDDAMLATITSNRGAIASKAVGGSSLRRLKVTTKSLPTMADTNWVPALVADMDGDGKPDIVWRNTVTGENTVWIMSGTQVTQTVAIESRPDLNWQIGGGGSSTDGSSGSGTPPSHGSTSLRVTVDPAAAGDPTAVTAALTASGAPVAQRQLVFTLSGTEISRLLTDATGSATAIIPTGTLPAGTYPNAVSVRFDGDASFDASSQSADLVITSAEASVTWKNPSAIVYGTPLSGAQLNATASVPGTFVYSPAAGAILNAGFQTLNVTFTPGDPTIASITRSAVVLVSKAPSSVSWTVPDSITYGTPLSDLQLNAASNLTGTFTYDPGPGTTLSVGNGHALKVTFAPDSPNFDLSNATTTIDVSKGNQLILWDDPAPITVLQPLGAAQLGATIIASGSAPPGPVTYDPPFGTTLTPGVHALLVSVGATDSYEAASASVDLIVVRVTPNVQWAQPANFVYGTALSNTQLNATADVPGIFTYTPPAGTILDAGTQQLSVVFTPADNRYDTVTTPVTIQVLRATQVITWSSPAPIVYGTLLSATQLNAQVTVGGPSPAGRLAYTVPLGSVLPAGPAQTLTVIAVATQNYDSVAASVTIDVLKATPIITWSPPAPIVYGTPLSATQLDAAANVPGTFAYTPASGTILNAGAGQTLQMAFTPTDAQDYTTASLGVPLTVTKANQTITWPNPADIVYGTLLSPAQLDAAVSVVGPASSGALTYTPPAGTLLQAGPGQTLMVAAAETTNYNSATATALLTVQKAKPVLTWANPSGIVYGTALSSTQLDATADVPGSLVYTPPAGTILNGGSAQTLSVSFTPTDTHNYENGTATAAIDVAKAKQTLSWSAPATIVYGTRLGATQLNATVTVVGPAAAGTLIYTPPAGAPLDAGTGQTLTVTAQETQNYLPSTMSVTIDVNRAPLTLRVDNQSKLYGAPLPTFTGTLTGVVNGDPITPQYSTTATVASVVGAYPTTGQLADPNGRLRNYDVTIVPATLTVGKTPLVVTADDTSKQYSDPLPQLSASFRGLVLGETPSVLGGTLLLQTNVTKDTGPGAYPIAVGGLTSPNYDITFVSGTLTVTQEDATVTFIAPLTVSASPVTGTATVTLASLVKDVPDSGDGSGPNALGDIRKATLTFINRATGQTLCTAPIGLVTASDTSTGVATCSFTATTATYTIESRVGGWYARDSAADDVTLSVLRPNDDFVTGGGYAQLTTSAGSYAADANSRADFTLNPQYDDKLGTVKGSVTLTFNRTENGSVHIYQISASSIASLAIVRTTAGGIAWITGPASLTDITAAKSPVVIDDSATIFASFVDNGQPATSDTLAVTLVAKNGGLSFSSKWNGSHTIDQMIDGGNINVHLQK